ncbi:tetratricopeptide repeat protein [Heliomarina baculiformis]|uniref:tetratricopeptide repeat protein n=1 Tax=Heliomarina baculiformis TaxID=2872036 RepID=UPI001EE328F4|nr:tetratricopeptide repeat protein [Heliomarina baculiformis]
MLKNKRKSEVIAGMTKEDTDIIHQRNNPSSSAVTFVFSTFEGVNRGARSFSFRHLLLDLDANIVYIKDRSNQWYNRGILGVGSDLSSTIISLKGIIESFGYTEVRCTGTSMGGYAAILFGNEIGAESILAFSPQTFLAPPYPRYNRSLHEGEYLDLSRNIASPVAKTRIIVGEDELFDLFGVARLPFWRHIDLQIVRAGTHMIPRFLHDAGVFKGTLVNLATTGEFSDLGVERSDLNFSAVASDLCVAAEGVYGRHIGEAKNVLQHFVRARPNWAGAHFWLGRVLEKQGIYDASAEHLEKAVELNPVMYEAASRAAQVHLKQENWSSALRCGILAWTVNKSLTGIRDRVSEAVIDLIKNGLKQENVSSQCWELLETLDVLFQREELQEHSLRSEVRELLAQRKMSDFKS